MPSVRPPARGKHPATVDAVTATRSAAEREVRVPAFKQDTRTLSNCISRLVPRRQTGARPPYRRVSNLPEARTIRNVTPSARSYRRLMFCCHRERRGERGNPVVERMNSPLDPPRASSLVPQLLKEKRRASKRTGGRGGGGRKGNVTTSHRSSAKRYALIRYDWQKFRLARALARFVKSQRSRFLDRQAWHA